MNRNELKVFHTSPGMTAPRKGRGTSCLTHGKRAGRMPRNVDPGRYILFPDGSLRRADRLPEAVLRRLAPKKVVRKAPAAKISSPTQMERQPSEVGRKIVLDQAAKPTPTLRDKFGRFLKRVAGGK